MMKRILYAVVVSMVAFTALGHSAKQISNDEYSSAVNRVISPEAASVIDSLSMIVGDVYGIGFGQLVRAEEDIDIAQVTKAVEILLNNQLDKDYVHGMYMGTCISDLFQAFKNEVGSDLNKELFFEHLKAELFTENPIDITTAYTLEERIGDLAEQISSNGEGHNNAIIDSLSIALGTLYGARTRNDDDSRSVDQEQALKGVVHVSSVQNDKNYMTAVKIRCHVDEMIEGIQSQTHMPLNLDLFREHLINRLAVESVAEEFEQLTDQIEPLINRAAELSPASIANKQAGEEYMKKLKADKTYKFTKSGLAYKMLKKGKGKKFKENDVVNVIYVGKHVDGTAFDSSEGEPIPLSVHQVIPGFAEMLKLMKPGSKAIVVIPSDLAYGTLGMQPQIGPNETLIFEMETVGVK